MESSLLICTASVHANVHVKLGPWVLYICGFIKVRCVTCFDDTAGATRKVFHRQCGTWA